MQQSIENVSNRERGAQRVDCLEVYRLKDGLRAVKFDSDGHGQFTMLAAGCIVHVHRVSSLRGFIEIVCDGELLSVFYEDLEQKGEKVSDNVDG